MLSNPYEIYGIKGVELQGDEEQKLPCPQPTCRNRQKSHLLTLGVNITKGVWHCMHCGWKGNIKENNLPDNSSQLPFTEPIMSDDIGRWFFDERGITTPVLEELGITQGDWGWRTGIKTREGADIFKQEPTIFFPNTMFGKVVNAKMRKFGAKDFSQLKGGYKLFYNLENVIGKETVIIVEGELDVCSLYQADIRNVISVPDGAPDPRSNNFISKFQFIDNSMTYLHSVNNVIIAVDNDEAGLKLREILATRFGKDICSFVEYPDGCKDMNDVLMQYDTDLIREIIAQAKPYPVDGVFTAKALRNQVFDIYKNGYEKSQKLGLGQFDEYVYMRTKFLYTITGIPNHGKSTFVDQILVKMMLQDWKVIIYSPETEQSEHIARQAEQLTGKGFYKEAGSNRLNPVELDQVIDFLDDHCYYLRTDDRNLTIEEIKETALVYVKRFGVKILVIDPFNTVAYKHKEYGGDKGEWIGHVLDSLNYFAKKNDVLVIVVAHPTKMLVNHKKGYDIPDPYKIADSAHFYNKSAVIITVFKKWDGDVNRFITEIYAQKIKNKTLGKVGDFDLNLDTDTQRFYSEYKNYDNFINAYHQRKQKLLAEKGEL